jgi:hypothetical protein
LTHQTKRSTQATGKASTLSLHPHHGIHDQRALTPPRRPGSIRRTTTLDCYWTGPLSGPCTIAADGRDLLTGPTREEHHTLHTVTLRATLTPPSAVVTSIHASDPTSDLRGLLGASVSSGFRRAVDQSVPDLDRAGVLYRILHDLPGASFVGSFVAVRAGAPPFTTRDLLGMENVCRGWRTDGVQMRAAVAGRVPILTGPAPTPLDNPADPVAWHEMKQVPFASVCRSRRLDLWRDGDEIVVDMHYRDTYLPNDQSAMAIHEYSLIARADGTSGTLINITTRAHALPWSDCDSIPASAEEVVGVRLGELDTAVRERLRGTAGCRHLNDTLRELDVAPALVAVLDEHL